MAALLNRSMSAVTEGISMRMAGGDAPPQRSLRESASSTSSPLQIFVKAKRNINDIYGDIDNYVRDAIQFIHSIPKDKNIISESEGKEMESYIQKVAGIREVLARDHMKVAFFGRTSNGKSTVINAMLHDKILPSGIGHTTNCFLQVEGSENGEAYLITEGSTEKQNVKSVGQLAHALCNEKLGESSLVRVFWPKQKCLLLRDDVVFVDSPGIDVSPNLDEWIDKHCLDADVFVLVANAESTLMVTEKNFFHKVSTRLSKPNIFILNNRWDASASEPEFLEQVRSQHVERDMDFLVKELKVCKKEEAAERIFFISAKEALQGRLQEQKGMPAHTGAIADGFPTRYFEFQDFERKFEECISKSAVKTKFEQHSQRGRHIASVFEGSLDHVYDKTHQQKAQQEESRKELVDKLDFTEKQLELLTHEMKEKISHMTEDVNQRVSKALSEEIRRLSVLVEEFSMPFHPDSLVLNVYKKELHSYVETGLGSNLRARLSSSLAANIQSSQREMSERMASLLPADKKQVSLNFLPRREPFEVLYRLNCDNLCCDFREDIQFRFSLGLCVLFGKFLRSGAAAFVSSSSSSCAGNGNGSEQFQTVRQYPATPQSPLPGEPYVVPQSNDWALISKVALATVTSQGTMGGLLVAGFLFKTVGWRVIAVSGMVYGCLYLYERLTWTNKAKERCFKKQYVDYVTRKLRMIVDLTSANCSHQVQQELSSTMARLSYLVDEARSEMQADITQLEKELKVLDEMLGSSKVLRNKANFLIKELEIFDEAYIRGKEE